MSTRPLARTLILALLAVFFAVASCDKAKIPTNVDCSKVENCLHLKCWDDPTCHALTEKFLPGGCKPGQVKDPSTQKCRDCTSADCDGVPSFCCASSACSDSIACGMYICKELASQCSGVTDATCGFHDLDGDDAWGDCDEAPANPCCLCVIGVGCADSPCKKGEFVDSNKCKSCSSSTCDELPCMGLNGCPSNCPPGKYFDGVQCRACDSSDMQALIPACDSSAGAKDAGATSGGGDDAGTDDGGAGGGGGGDDDAGVDAGPVAWGSKFPCESSAGLPGVFIVQRSCPDKHIDDWAVVPGPVLGDKELSFNAPEGKCNDAQAATQRLDTPGAVCDTLGALQGEEAKGGTNRKVPASFEFCGSHYDCPTKGPADLRLTKSVTIGGIGLGIALFGGKVVLGGTAILSGGILFLGGVAIMLGAVRYYRNYHQPKTNPLEDMLAGAKNLVEKNFNDKMQAKDQFTKDELKELGVEYKKFSDMSPAERAELRQEMQKQGVDYTTYAKMMQQMSQDAKGGNKWWE